MTETIDTLLGELKTGLASIFGKRLRGVYLYGSRARGDGDRESDLDVLVVLDAVSSYSAEVERTSTLVAGLSLRFGVTVSRVFVSERDWQHGQTPFLLNAREEAVAA